MRKRGNVPPGEGIDPPLGISLVCHDFEFLPRPSWNEMSPRTLEVARAWWLIETRCAGGDPKWFTARPPVPWGTANEAIQFARREDAEAMLKGWNSWCDLTMLAGAVVTERCWPEGSS